VHTTESTDDSKLPSFWVALAPLLTIFILNFVLVRFVFVASNPNIMARFAPFGGLNNNWSLIIALFSGILLSLFLFRKQIGNIDATLGLVSRGAESSLTPLFNTALIIGFGGVIKMTAAFEVIKHFIFGLEIPGLFKVALATGMMSAITGSSSGGAGIALDAFKDSFLAMGLDPQAIHRIMLVAAGGLDTLPHCGAVVTLLGVCAVSPRKSYADIGMVTVVGPVIATIAMIGFNLMTGLV
jgi:H+/gluconate symporter-like permease